MRRATSIVALSLMLIVIVGTTVSAKGQGGAAAVTFSAEGGTGPAGGTLSVSAAVHGAAPGTMFSAVALVHFATGNVSVALGPEGTTPLRERPGRTSAIIGTTIIGGVTITIVQDPSRRLGRASTSQQRPRSRSRARRHGAG